MLMMTGGGARKAPKADRPLDSRPAQVGPPEVAEGAVALARGLPKGPRSCAGLLGDMQQGVGLLMMLSMLLLVRSTLRRRAPLLLKLSLLVKELTGLGQLRGLLAVLLGLLGEVKVPSGELQPKGLLASLPLGMLRMLLLLESPDCITTTTTCGAQGVSMRTGGQWRPLGCAADTLEGALAGHLVPRMSPNVMGAGVGTVVNASLRAGMPGKAGLECSLDMAAVGLGAARGASSDGLGGPGGTVAGGGAISAVAAKGVGNGVGLEQKGATGG